MCGPLSPAGHPAQLSQCKTPITTATKLATNAARSCTTITDLISIIFCTHNFIHEVASFFLLFSTITSALTAARQCKLNMSSNSSSVFAWFMYATETHFALFISLRFSENFREIKSAKPQLISDWRPSCRWYSAHFVAVLQVLLQL